MFKLNLVTPEKKILTDHEVEEVVVPGQAGQLDILPGHAPLLTTLNAGVLEYKEPGSNERKSVVLSWGYCEVNPKGIHVLAETAEVPEELDHKRAENALKRSEAKLKEGLTVGETIKHQRKLSRARTRIGIIKKMF